MSNFIDAIHVESLFGYVRANNNKLHQYTSRMPPPMFVWLLPSSATGTGTWYRHLPSSISAQRNN